MPATLGGPESGPDEKKIRHIDVYETPQALVLVGRFPSGQHRVALVRRTHDTEEDRQLPPVTEDADMLGDQALAERLSGLRATKLLEADALLGMVRFLEGWYLLLVTGREPVGVISGHVIFRVEETAMLSVSSSTLTVSKPERHAGGPTEGGAEEGGGASDQRSTAVPAVAGGQPAVAVRSSTEGYGEDGDGGDTATAVPGMDEDKARRGVRGFTSLFANATSEFVGRLMRGSWGDGWAENRYRSLFQTMELTRDFYFSYTYDLTNTLQENMGGAAPAPAPEAAGAAVSAAGSAAAGGAAARGAARRPPELRHKFLWNHHLFCGLLQRGLSRAWLPPLVHGFFRQQSLTVFGRALTLTVVARRSRLFAGARLLKRGLCRAGHVANEVETEQIVGDGLRGALHEGGMCAAVQLRGSIPLMWGHGEQKQIVPRPDIHLQRCEPRASAPPPPPDP